MKMNITMMYFIQALDSKQFVAIRQLVYNVFEVTLHKISSWLDLFLLDVLGAVIFEVVMIISSHS
ncbi:MAG: hypothetical protein DI539_24880 [Flavobacterium psychrophilum]|nr:MAG: hypothetical protein DI539_24880 [Flavobacterium psychrophilum]